MCGCPTLNQPEVRRKPEADYSWSQQISAPDFFCGLFASFADSFARFAVKDLALSQFTADCRKIPNRRERNDIKLVRKGEITPAPKGPEWPFRCRFLQSLQSLSA